MREQLQTALSRANIQEEIVEIERLAGGKNNRVYLCRTVDTHYIAKQYFPDRRDRQRQEEAFLRYCRASSIEMVPYLFCADRQQNISILSFEKGHLLEAQDLHEKHIIAAQQFIAQLQTNIAHLELPRAIDCCFEKSEHIEQTRWRLQRLQDSSRDSDLEIEMHSFLPRLQSAFQQSCKAISSAYLHRECASPSDFGFHNALVSDEKICFIDFEYAGRDSVQKLLCDFFCQPRVPVSLKYLSSFCAILGGNQAEQLEQNILELLPMYRIKWCTILLNEFTTNRERRDFALQRDENRARLQLEKAKCYWQTHLQDRSGLS